MERGHAARSKWAIEECARLNVTRDLFRTGQIGFGGWSSGQWQGMTWRTLLSASGSFIEIDGRRWELVPHVSSSAIEGARWYLRDPSGRRVTTLSMTPDGKVGSRWELGLGYRSQRLWTKSKKRAWKRLKIVTRIDGPIDFDWVVWHPQYVSKGRRLMRSKTYQKLVDRLAAVR